MQYLPWIIALVALMLLGAVLAAWAWQRRGQRARRVALPTEWDLTARPVFTAAERRLHQSLREALPHHVLLPRLPLTRFCQPTDPNESDDWRRRLANLEIGFAICSENGRVLTAIDLESDHAPSRREMQIKRAVLSACRVRYLRCAVDQWPTAAELQLLVPRAVRPANAPQSGADPRASVARDAGPVDHAPKATARRALWDDPPVFRDSFFGVDGPQDAPTTASFARFSKALHATADAASPDRMGQVERRRTPLGAEPDDGAEVDSDLDLRDERAIERRRPARQASGSRR